ncbi:MAG: UDP-N-acetylmuramoyl-L-alanyl-D-glutamate--2,6-diaminopimelate ligase [Verrucomicrobia bacterium]|nr:UDP-N-acetylmuramoyl-L-alanyl-D-glutamate--2,6-diaminopimelate ligase [Verrucomicrobiota bacterium]
MQLKDISRAVQAIRVDGPMDRDITGLTCDSRQVMPGMIFVAVPGAHVDGHDFIPNAIDRGATAILCERNGFVSPRATKIKVASVRHALAQAAAAFYGHPAQKLKVIGVTGTNGKTTVAFMIKHILEAAGTKTGLIGTVRYEVGDRVIPASRTTPEALETQRLMAQMLQAECKACVMEVSSHSLEQHRVGEVEFDVAVFTNLTQDHLDYHGTMENYFAAKQKLFTFGAAGSKRATHIINIDDSYGVRLWRDGQAEVKLTYALHEHAHVRATHIHLSKDASRFRVDTPQGGFNCQLPLIGRHNIYNALASIGCALGLEVPLETVQLALAVMPPVPGRLESVALGQPFGVFVDYAHTDDALHNVLTTLREMTPGRLILAFGCGGNRDAGKRPKMGKVAAQQADYTIITSDNPRREAAADIAHQIELGYREARGDGYAIELDRRRAITEVIGMAREGDTVLIAGKGHETYQEYDDTVIPFDDRVFARETLEGLGFKKGLRRHEKH